MREDRCPAVHPWREGFRCELADGHAGEHRTWTAGYPGVDVAALRTEWGSKCLAVESFTRKARQK